MAKKEIDMVAITPNKANAQQLLAGGGCVVDHLEMARPLWVPPWMIKPSHSSSCS